MSVLEGLDFARPFREEVEQQHTFEVEVLETVCEGRIDARLAEEGGQIGFGICQVLVFLALVHEEDPLRCSAKFPVA